VKQSSVLRGIGWFVSLALFIGSIFWWVTLGALTCLYRSNNCQPDYLDHQVLMLALPPLVISVVFIVILTRTYPDPGDTSDE